MNQSLNALPVEMRESYGSLLTEMNSRINNLIVIVVGSWITVVAGAIALFIKG